MKSAARTRATASKEIVNNDVSCAPRVPPRAANRPDACTARHVASNGGDGVSMAIAVFSRCGDIPDAQYAQSTRCPSAGAAGADRSREPRARRAARRVRGKPACFRRRRHGGAEARLRHAERFRARGAPNARLSVALAQAAARPREPRAPRSRPHTTNRFASSPAVLNRGYCMRSGSGLSVRVRAALPRNCLLARVEAAHFIAQV